MADRGRAARMTKAQKEALVAFMEKNTILLSLKPNPNNLELHKNKWLELAETLNNMGGAQKQVREWKESFAQFKEQVRKKARGLAQDINGTGGGPRKQKALKLIEERLLALLSPIVITGVPDVPEGGITMGVTEEQNIELSFEQFDNSFIGLTDMNISDVEVVPPPSNSNELNTMRPITSIGYKTTPAPAPTRRRRVEEPQFVGVAREHEACLERLVQSNLSVAGATMRLAKEMSRKRRQCPVLQFTRY